jgi:hypothetical protein
MNWSGNKNIYILLIVGLLLVLLNKPLGYSFRDARMRMEGRDYGIRAFRAPVIGIGLLLVFIGVAGLFVD